MTQGEIEKLTVKVSNIFSELEVRIMTDIVRRIKENGFASASVDWQISRLQQLGMAEEDIRGWIQSALQTTDTEMDRIFSDEVYKQYYEQEHFFKLAGMQQIPLEENFVIQQLIEATKKQLQGEYKNLTGSMGFAIRNPATGRIQSSESDDKGVKVGMRDIEASVKRMSTSVEGLGEKAKIAIQKQLDSLSKLNNQYVQQEQKVNDLKQRMKELSDQKIETDKYKHYFSY